MLLYVEYLITFHRRGHCSKFVHHALMYAAAVDELCMSHDLPFGATGLTGGVCCRGWVSCSVQDIGEPVTCTGFYHICVLRLGAHLVCDQYPQ